MSDPAHGGLIFNRVRNHIAYITRTDAAVAWMNANRPRVRVITTMLTNLVCTVPYVFRQKGHHYIDGTDYDDVYYKIWAKVIKDGAIFVSPWKHLATSATHAIMPCVLDQYWGLCVANGRVAAPLQLR